MNLSPTEAKRALRAEVKHGISAMLPPRKRNTAKDICLFSSRRGGSTWLMQTLCAHPGLRHIDQPFSHWTVPPHLLHKIPGQVAAPLGLRDEELASRYFDRILSGRLNVNSRWDFWHSGFWQKPERMVVKILAAKGIMDWFCDNFDICVIYQIRHPIAQALSVLRAGWGLEVDDYLGNERYVSENLTAAQARYAHEIMAQGSPLERQVLEWCLDNLSPFRLLRDRPDWLLTTYEQGILEPDKIIRAMADHADLPHREAMRRQITVPSRTAGITNDPNHLAAFTDPGKISKWRRSVSDEEEKRCMAIVAHFEIDFYQCGRERAAPGYLIP